MTRAYTTDELLFSKIQQTQILITRRFHQLLSANHAMLGQYKLMFLLHSQSNLSQREIADLLSIRPSSAGELVERASRAGYVNRERDENDSRIFRVSITEKGEQALQESMDAVRRITGELLQNLDEEDREQMLRLLVKMKSGLENACNHNQLI